MGPRSMLAAEPSGDSIRIARISPADMAASNAGPDTGTMARGVVHHTRPPSTAAKTIQRSAAARDMSGVYEAGDVSDLPATRRAELAPNR